MNHWVQQIMHEATPQIKSASKIEPREEREATDPFSQHFPYQKRFDLGLSFPDVYFTRREAQSVYYLLRGMTMRETSIMMALSPRTVEFYLNNVKRKLECNRKRVLLERIRATSLWSLFKTHVRPR